MEQLGIGPPEFALLTWMTGEINHGSFVQDSNAPLAKWLQDSALQARITICWLPDSAHEGRPMLKYPHTGAVS